MVPANRTTSHSPGTWRSSPEVETAYGPLRGAADRENTWSWLGIPYAKPPIGQLRWRAPQRPAPWTVVRSARRFGNPCAQKIPYVGLPMGSEDCLYLNVWRPRTDEGNLPVYVYLHGGGNTIGTCGYPDFFGHAVAARSNMVYVSLNYRLSVFGWFRHPCLAEGAHADDASGNYGTLDIIAALSWVQENIGAFGGNPDCVTLSGESAGAFNVLSLMQAPRARGLFHRAVVQSGLPTMQDIGTAESAASEAVSRLRIRRGAKVATLTGADLAAFLRTVPANELLRTLTPSPMGMGMADYPTIYTDGVVLPAAGYGSLGAEGFVNQVPLIIGSNRDEWKLFIYMKKGYKRHLPSYLAEADRGSALWRYQGVDRVARALSCSGRPPVYSYRFDWGWPNKDGSGPLPRNLGSWLGAFHTVEVGFFLGTGINSAAPLVGWPFSRANSAGRMSLTRVVMEYLATFARTGDPNPPHGSLPRWQPWDNRERGFKALALDVDGDVPRITPLHYEPTTVSDGVDLGLLARFPVEETPIRDSARPAGPSQGGSAYS